MLRPPLTLLGLEMAQTWCSVEEGCRLLEGFDMTGEGRIQLEWL